MSEAFYNPENLFLADSPLSSGHAKADLICFSHLRWDWVFQRPQHLMTRFARDRRVFYFEEPAFGARTEPTLDVKPAEGNVAVVTPNLPAGLSEEGLYRATRDLVENLLKNWHIEDYVAWFYSPLFLPYTSHLRPRITVYDCMDELSAFAGAHPALLSREAELLSRADLVLTGGMSLYEAKKHRHANAHAFPSSIDKAHFGKARERLPEPEDQKSIPHPRIGFHGVIDERFDLELLAEAARLRPEWHWILLGPVCKIDEATLPRASNIHYLGKKEYSQLPAYLSGWDIGMMPFARNEATRYISPTKTPEYLAAGLPVVSTSIRDVVDPYERLGLVLIADSGAAFVAACEAAFARGQDDSWKSKVREFLSQISWDRTWAAMDRLMGNGNRPQAMPALQTNGRRNHV